MMVNPFPSELQYMKDGVIDSNSQFFYKDITSFNYDHRIKLDPAIETKMDIRNQIPVHHLTQAVIKELPQNNEMNAFEKADIEAEFIQQCSKHKYQLLLQKEKDISGIVSKRWKIIRDEIQTEKDKLKETLTKIIRDSLIFSKKNNPMSSMVPGSISDIVTKIKEDKNVSISFTSVNVSNISKGSGRSTKKYESNAFLRSLGLDLEHLSPDNINIDIDKAYDYVKSWNSNRKDTDEVIRYLVVNGVMSVEEKIASQRAEKINKKIKKYKERKNEMRVKYQESMKEQEKSKPIVKVVKVFKPQPRPKSSVKPATPPKKGVKVSERLSKKPRSKSKKKREESPKEKIRIYYNAYQHVDKILNFIHNSEELSDNPSVCKHFLNIKNKKRMDDLTNKLKMKNRIEAVIEGSENNTKF